MLRALTLGLVTSVLASSALAHPSSALIIKESLHKLVNTKKTSKECLAAAGLHFADGVTVLQGSNLLYAGLRDGKYAYENVPCKLTIEKNSAKGIFSARLEFDTEKVKKVAANTEMPIEKQAEFLDHEITFSKVDGDSIACHSMSDPKFEGKKSNTDLTITADRTPTETERYYVSVFDKKVKSAIKLGSYDGELRAAVSNDGKKFSSHCTFD